MRSCQSSSVIAIVSYSYSIIILLNMFLFGTYKMLVSGYFFFYIIAFCCHKGHCSVKALLRCRRESSMKRGYFTSIQVFRTLIVNRCIWLKFDCILCFFYSCSTHHGRSFVPYIRRCITSLLSKFDCFLRFLFL
jgi:hypothetical protein